jgi:hypothetical protein
MNCARITTGGFDRWIFLLKVADMSPEDRKALVGIIVGVAWGGLTMAGPLAFPNAPQWVWQASFSLAAIIVLAGIAVLAYDFFIRPKGKRLDPLIAIAIIAMFVAMVSLGIYVARGPQIADKASSKAIQDKDAAQTPPPAQKEAFVKNLKLEFQEDERQDRWLFLTGTAAVTIPRLKVFIDYSGKRPLSGFWEPRQKVQLEGVEDKVRGEAIKIRLTYRHTEKPELARWNEPRYGMAGESLTEVRARILLIAPNGAEQRFHFLYFGGMKFMSESELSFEKEWEREDSAH